MDFYRSLMAKACKKPVDERSLEMLEMVRSFLDIPSDIHLSLLIEVRDRGAEVTFPMQGEAIAEDMNNSLDRWMAQHIKHQGIVRDLLDEFKEGTLDVKTPGGDLHSYSGLMEEMIVDGRKRKKESLATFERRYVKP